ncbi:MAG: hypothetical protein ACI4TK_05145 [Agathobacter sp.]
MERLTKQFNGGYLFNMPYIGDIKAQEEYIDKVSIKLGQYEDAEGQGLLLRLPCKVGDTVYVRACCECVSPSKDFETGVSECPFEDECPFDECENGNERLFKTSVMCIWNDGNGWYLSVRGLCIDIPFIDFGTSVFLTKEEAEQKLAEMKEE